MNVAVIFHYDDCSGGVPGASAIVRIPEGKTLDDTFLAWVREKENDPKITLKDVEEDADRFMYYWAEYDVTEINV